LPFALEAHSYAVDIVFADVDRQVFAPPVGNPLETQAAAGFYLGDAVGTTAQRRLEAGTGEVTPAPVVPGQHRQLAKVKNLLAGGRLLEDEAYPQRCKNTDPRHVLQVVAVLWVSVFFQGAPGKLDIGCRDWPVIMKAGLLAQVEHHPAQI